MRYSALSLSPLKQTSSTPKKPLPQQTFDSGMIIKLNLYQTQTHTHTHPHTHKQQNKIVRRWQRWERIGLYCVKIYIVSLPCNQPCCFIVFGSSFLLIRSFTTGSGRLFSYGGGWSMRSYLFPIGSIDRSIAFLHSINQSINQSIDRSLIHAVI